MLMMLAPFGGSGKKPIAADAHDAGSVLGGLGQTMTNPLQLMLMMLAPF